MIRLRKDLNFITVPYVTWHLNTVMYIWRHFKMPFTNI